MKDTIPITVKLRGGEAMYITPVSYDWRGKNNKFHIYSTIEFLPNIPSNLKEYSYHSKNKLHYIQLWRYKIAEVTKAFLQTFLDNLKRCSGSNVFCCGFKNWTWDWGFYYISKELTNDWFYSVDVFQPYNLLHLKGNIELNWLDASKYINQDNIGYLSPSSLWVEERLKEEFHVWTFDKEEDKVAKKEFYQWKEEQEAKGYEVCYITSLET